MPATSATLSPPRPSGPRSRFPGQLIYAFRSNPLGFLTRTARTYGDFSAFTIGRMRWQMLNDPEATRDVLVTKAEQFQKSPALRAAKVTLGEGLLTSEGDFHRRQRRLSQPAFHPNRVAVAYAPAFVALAEDTASRWQDGQVIDVHEEMMRLTLRIVTKTLFSAEIEHDIDEIGQHMDVLVKMFRRATSPFARVLNKLPLPSNYRFFRSRDAVRKTIDRFVREHREAGADRGDLLSTLIRAHDAGTEGTVRENGEQTVGGDESMSDLQLRDELMTLFTAGHETTANALTFTWYLLGQHPDVAERVSGEIDAALQGRLPTPDDLDQLPFLRAVLSESMRLYPPAWLVVREAKEDVRVGANAKYLLSKGSVTIMSQWVAHRDPRWWPEPETFRPKRWLEKAPDRPRYAYFPFGGGPRSCIGEAFAWSEALLVLATLLRRCHLSPADDAPLRLEPTITLRPKDPVRMTVKRKA
jgi:cytochrome P450